MMTRPARGAPRIRPLAALLALLVGACAGEGTSGSTDEPTGSSSDDPTSGSATTAGTSTDGASTDGTTADAASMGDTTMDDTATTADTMPPSDTGVMPPVPKSCALEVIDPNADPAAVIDAGDAEGQIPTSVGETLLRNCGCHYTDDVPIGPYVDYKSNDQPMATLADFHADFTGTFPVDFERMPAYEAVEERVVHSNPLPMPPFGCGVEGEPGRISAADLQLLTDWLAAGAPDGASFP
jgi:hypothetical protein